jgi:hypothetical protein
MKNYGNLIILFFFTLVILLIFNLETFSTSNNFKKPDHNSKTCIYTCITGNYDNNVYFGKDNVNCDLLLFTNNKDLGEKFNSKGWIVKYIDDPEITDNKLLARKHKSLTHRYIPDKYDISIWIDGSIGLKNNFFNVTEFLEEIEIDKYNIVCKKHPNRNTIKDEAKIISKLKFEKDENINKVLDILKKNNFKDDVGLSETGILIRKHKNNSIIESMEEWFNLIKICIRDQISFDYILWKYRLLYSRKEYKFFHNKYFRIFGHYNTKNKIIEAFLNFFY